MSSFFSCTKILRQIVLTQQIEADRSGCSTSDKRFIDLLDGLLLCSLSPRLAFSRFKHLVFVDKLRRCCCSHTLFGWQSS